MIRILTALFLLLVTALPAWAQQAPNTWAEIPSSRLDQSPIAAPLIQSVTPYGETSGLPGLMAYSGATYDTLRHQLLLVGTGGHGDWGGNQVVALQVNADLTVTWAILQPTGKRSDGATWVYPYLLGPTHPVCAVDAAGASLLPLQPWPCRETSKNLYADGTKPSMHTYGNQAYMAWEDAVLTAGGLRWWDAEPNKPSPGFPHGASQATWWWKQGTGYILKLNDGKPGGYGGHMVADPATQTVYIITASTLSRYASATNSWSTLLSGSSGGVSASTVSSQVVLDPAARRLYRFNHQPSNGTAIRMIDLAGGPERLLSVSGEIIAMATPGAALMWDAELPGLVTVGKDSANAANLALYTMTLSSPCGLPAQPPCVWVKRAVLPAYTYSPSGNWGRLFKRDGHYFYWAQYGKNVQRYRPDWGSAPPPLPDRTLTIEPAGPGAGTTSGAGPYPHGTVVTPVQAPDDNSTALGLGGDCVNGSVTMDADKVCSSTFGLRTRTLTLLTAGTGAGTVSGGGGYPHGTQAIIASAPAPGSATAGVSGAGCPAQPGPVVMDADKTCTVTVNDVQPPSVAITAPADGAYITQPGTLQIGYQISDNMPGGGTTTCAINGTPVPCGAWDVPAGTPSGPRTITVQHVDAAGNSGQASITVHVTLCACQVTGPPPDDGIAARTWTALEPKAIDPRTGAVVRTPFVASKHTRLAYDSKRKQMVLAGGDYAVPEVPEGSGVGNYVWAIDLKTKAPWRNLHQWCGPNGVQPERPDNVTWTYDPKRDVMYVIPAYFFGATKCPTGISATKEAYTFNLDRKEWNRANLQKPGAWGGDSHNHFGCLDPVTDTIYRWYWTGSSTVQRVPLDGSAVSHVNIGTALYGDMSNDGCAMDVEGRAMYGISRRANAVVKFSIPDLRVVATFPLPAGWVKPTLENETIVAFDTKNRVLLHLNTFGYSGRIRGLYFLTVDAGTWEVEGPTADLTIGGNTVGYDPANNVFLFVGGHSMTKHWLYRYL